MIVLVEEWYTYFDFVLFVKQDSSPAFFFANRAFLLTFLCFCIIIKATACNVMQVYM